MLLHRKYGSRKVARLFGRRRSSGVSDFPCLHGNERYATCDDASTEIASTGCVYTQPSKTPLSTCEEMRIFEHRGEPLAPTKTEQNHLTPKENARPYSPIKPSRTRKEGIIFTENPFFFGVNLAIAMRFGMIWNDFSAVPP